MPLTPSRAKILVMRCMFTGGLIADKVTNRFSVVGIIRFSRLPVCSVSYHGLGAKDTKNRGEATTELQAAMVWC